MPTDHSSEEIYSRIEEIDREAERLLAEAKLKAKKILEDAQRESNDMSASELPLDDIEKEQDKIIRAAREEADKQGKEAQQKALDLKKCSLEKADQVVRMILNYVMKIS
jgi:vacuolar-type H+-ATPase subunit H